MTHIVQRSDFTVPPPSPPEPPAPPRAPVQPPVVLVQPVWEYKHLVRRPAEEAAADETELNRFGAAGWELVNAVFDGSMVHLYLKRQVR